ncbi:MAG: fatty acid desaturase, partial [Verrucomicrobiota bacterium]|nr:fatty acid desaturase [Verrucomicrobiota bacterium]
MTPSPDRIEEPHWVSRSAYHVVSVLFVVSEMALAAVLYQRFSIWLVLAFVLVISHLMHGSLVGFHEASHGSLQRNRRFNELNGVVLGMLSFMSFSLYRAAHQTHHANLGTERDEELWPFVLPRIPRWKRVLAALLELNAGLFFTPFLFQRTFLRNGSPIRQKKVRRRIWNEIIATVVIWVVALAVVAYFDGWRYFLWMYLGPAIIAGNLQ